MVYSALRPRPNVFRAGISQGSHRRAGGTAVDTRSFQALSAPSGYGNLNQTMTINSIGVSPTFLYRGQDASAGSWTAAVGGQTLTESGTGASPSYGAPSPSTLDTEKAVILSGGKVLLSPSSTLGNGSTNDMVIEAVFRLGQNNGCLVAKANVAGSLGWMLEQTGSSTVTLWVKNGTTATASSITGVAGTWIHVIAFVDRSEASANGCIVYVNGAPGTGVNMSAQAASIDTTDPLVVGQFTDGTQKSTSTVSWVGQWQAASWFAGGTTNPTQWQAVATDRFTRLQGLFPQLALGTALPATQSRTTIAYMDIVNQTSSIRTLFPMGAQWNRFAKRQNLASGTFVSGALLEAQSTNLALQSETFDNASWVKLSSAVTANTTASPTGDVTADGLVGDATSAQHGVAQIITLTAATYVMSAWVKAGSMAKCFLENSTIATCRAWFDLTTGAVGTTEANVLEAICEPWGNGWFRCSIKFTGTAASHTLRLSAATTDGNALTTGDAATVNIQLYGAQVEVNDIASTYIPTTTAAATRTLDTLQYNTSDGNFVASSPGLLQADIITPNYDSNAWVIGLISAGSTSSTPDSVQIGATASDFGNAQMSQASASQYAINGTTVNVSNGEKHTIKTVWDVNVGQLFVDGAQEGATDTSVTLITTAPATLTLGQFNGASSTNGLISNVIIRKATA